MGRDRPTTTVASIHRRASQPHTHTHTERERERDTRWTFVFCFREARRRNKKWPTQKKVDRSRRRGQVNCRSDASGHWVALWVLSLILLLFIIISLSLSSSFRSSVLGRTRRTGGGPAGVGRRVGRGGGGERGDPVLSLFIFFLFFHPPNGPMINQWQTRERPGGGGGQPFFFFSFFCGCRGFFFDFIFFFDFFFFFFFAFLDPSTRFFWVKFFLSLRLGFSFR